MTEMKEVTIGVMSGTMEMLEKAAQERSIETEGLIRIILDEWAMMEEQLRVDIMRYKQLMEEELGKEKGR